MISIFATTNFICGLSTIAMGIAFSYILIRFRPMRDRLLAQIDEALRNSLISAMSSLWYLPLMFFVGGTSRLFMTPITANVPIATLITAVAATTIASVGAFLIWLNIIKIPKLVKKHSIFSVTPVAAIDVALSKD